MPAAAVSRAVIRGSFLVRDKDGRPRFDKPLSEYPPEVREAFLACMTAAERKEFDK
jgi:hypothetical protein